MKMIPRRFRLLAIIVLGAFLVSGCSTMLPKSEKTSEFTWTSHKEVETAYSLIEPGKTNRLQLRVLGFDPKRTPGGKALGYFETRNLITPPGQNVDITKLPTGLKECYDAGDHCTVEVFPIERLRSDQEGNFLANKTEWKVKTRNTGWKFYPKFFIRRIKPGVESDEDVVIYKDKDSDPNINTLEQKDDKMGPVKTFWNFLSSPLRALTGF